MEAWSFVDLIKVVRVFVRLFVQHVKSETAWLVFFGAQGVHFDSVQEALPLIRLDLTLTSATSISLSTSLHRLI